MESKEEELEGIAKRRCIQQLELQWTIGKWREHRKWDRLEFPKRMDTAGRGRKGDEPKVPGGESKERSL